MSSPFDNGLDGSSLVVSFFTFKFCSSHAQFFIQEQNCGSGSLYQVFSGEQGMSGSGKMCILSAFVHVNSRISDSGSMMSVGPDTSPLESATTSQNTIITRHDTVSH